MEKQQEDAYKDAIEEYRSASRARVDRNAKTNLNSIYGVLPRRQISNYFVQFRKVCETFSAYLSWIKKFVLLTQLAQSVTLFHICSFMEAWNVYRQPK